METHLADWLRGTPDGDEAEAILRRCVHCGFCTATCPTYQILGDELDGPRGRIYLMKQVMEGATPTHATLTHLDRCLTCRNCETTCPSGVQYGRLVDIGRALVEKQVKRPLRERVVRTVLRETLTRRWVFDPAMKIGQALRPLVPGSLKDKVPVARPAGARPRGTHARKVILLDGCVQPAMAPSIDTATARVLDAVGVQAIVAPGSGCCGAIRQHLNDHEGGLDDVRRNVAAWFPLLESGEAEALVMNVSGCGAMVKEYGHLLRNDPAWAERAKRVSEATLDLGEYLPRHADALRARLGEGGDAGSPQRVVFHPPCTLQHGQKVRGEIERLLVSLGAELTPNTEPHLCCGSAGTYSVLHPEMAGTLRERKLGALQGGAPDMILSANIGCITHLQAGTGTPVRHWVEWLDARLEALHHPA